jgi:hypothetical protein
VLPTVEDHCSATSVNRKLAALTSFCESGSTATRREHGNQAQPPKPAQHDQ